MIKNWREQLKVLLLTVLVLLFFSPKAYAAKQITLTPNPVSVEVGKRLEVKIEIDTNGEKVGAVGFTVNFPTEILEGLSPSHSGSVFPMCAVQSATRFDCGIVGQQGFTGTGLISTLVFRGRKAGEATIEISNFEARLGPSEVQGFSYPSIIVSVYGEGEAPPPTPDPTSPEPITPSPTTTSTGEKISPQSSNLQPNQTTGSQPKEPSGNNSVSGSTSKVDGQKGAKYEGPLKPASPSSENVMVKGFSLKNPMYYGILPTLLLLVLVVNLGLKLYFTEKRRHLELVRIFDTHLGALSSLESKLDLVDQKGEGGKEQILQEFEAAKTELTNEEKTKLSHSKTG